jgi:coenzyme F420-0:L-glutamate ligase/coenzyme F420-1:gamma-L-glutamate ligase
VISFTPITGLPEFHPGDDLVTTIASSLRDGDVVVLSQKIVSKVENRFVDLASIEPSARATQVARECGKDPRLVEVVLRESTDIVRVAKNVLITRHKLGFVLANAGVDQSNVPGGRTLLLPADPDASAQRLRDESRKRFGIDVAVLVCDSFGRAWRMGVVGTCIGCSGLVALHDRRGETDREGRKLEVTQVAVADQICATASLVAGEGSEGTPIVIARGVPASYRGNGTARDLLRPLDQDLFQ